MVVSPLTLTRPLSIYSICFSAVSPNGLNEKYTTVQASGDVLSLLKLEDGGLAAGLDEKYMTLHEIGDVLSLLKLEDGGLAADTDASTVDLFNISAVSPDGLNGSTRPCKRMALSFHW